MPNIAVCRQGLFLGKTDDPERSEEKLLPFRQIDAISHRSRSRPDVHLGVQLVLWKSQATGWRVTITSSEGPGFARFLACEPFGCGLRAIWLRGLLRCGA
jgi:hypothetical protein